MADSRKESFSPQAQADLMLASETMRVAGSPPPPTSETKEDKGIPLIWRIFGGTVLSIAAMVAVTLYQQIHNKVESLSDALVKREEFFEHRKGVWERFQSMQKQGDAVDTDLKQRCARLEEQVKINEQLRQEIIPELKQLREMAVAHLKDTSTRLDQQVKSSEEERKKLVDEIRQLQDRVVRLDAGSKSSELKSALYQKKQGP